MDLRADGPGATGRLWIHVEGTIWAVMCGEAAKDDWAILQNLRVAMKVPHESEQNQGQQLLTDMFSRSTHLGSRPPHHPFQWVPWLPRAPLPSPPPLPPPPLLCAFTATPSPPLLPRAIQPHFPPPNPASRSLVLARSLSRVGLSALVPFDIPSFAEAEAERCRANQRPWPPPLPCAPFPAHLCGICTASIA
ncbi:hypothetical protein BJ912DRAFT_1063027 [Pholiota molesta]|nr:hypothetical protein BJ912DRAFT_1063027 [Pholiota molesta]